MAGQLKNMIYYIYVLKSLKDSNLYIGCTADLQRRIKDHQKGRVKSSKYRRPLQLIYNEKYDNKYEAYKKERYYKTAKGKKELKNRLLHT